MVNMRQNKGITLVSLVVMIIVLIIIASITIKMVGDDNGMLNQATTARIMTIEGEVDDDIKMTTNALKSEIISERANNLLYDAQTHENMLKHFEFLKNSLEKKGGYTIEMDEPNLTFTITYESADYKNATKNNSAKIRYQIIVEKADCSLTKIN